MSYNLIFIDESESMQRAITTIFQGNPEFSLNLIKEPSSIYKAAKNFKPDIIVLSYNTIDTDLKKSITELKTSKEFSETPLLLLVPSDLSDKERDILIKLKTDGFIYRPFDKDKFILKVKKALSIPEDDKSGKISENITENKKNAINEGKYTTENNTIKSDKIFDISDFEIKKNNENLNFQNISSAVSMQENNNNAGSNENTPSDMGNSDIEAAELSQAFENLFKDDAIFKEFQELNKKDGRLSATEESDNIRTEAEAKTAAGATSMQEIETNSAHDITQTGEEKNEPAISIMETQNKLEKEPAPDIKKIEEQTDIAEKNISEPFLYEKIQETSTESENQPNQPINNEKNKQKSEEIKKSADHLWSIESSDSFESNPLNELMSSLNVNQTSRNVNNNADDINTGIFDLSAPESGLEINGDSLKGTEETPELHASAYEKPLPNNQDFNEPFTGFNIALSDEKTSTKEKGELKLKILNEQSIADMDSYLKNAIETVISEIKPDITEAVKNMIPDIIEKIVKDEIEKIKQS